MFSKTYAVFGAIVVAATMATTSPTLAMSVDIGGNVSPGIIFSGSVANGSWTGNQENGVEVALRGKLRFDDGGAPQNTFNYDGNHTYRFDPAFSSPLAGWSIFNFEYSVNVDVDDSNDRVLGDLTYNLEILKDGVGLDSGDIIRGWLDNALGSNSTGTGGGVSVTPASESVLDIASAWGTFFGNLNTNNVAQNSLNLGFGFSDSPQDEGTYTFNLIVLDGATTLAATSIDIIVGAVPAVPVPAALPLFGTGLAIMGFVGWRRRKVTAKNIAA